MTRAWFVVVGFLLVGSPPVIAQDRGPQTRVLGFTDFGYVAGDGTKDDGFRLGQLVAQASSQLTPRVAFFTELTATRTATGIRFGMERVIFRYDFSDALKLSGGKYHLPISYWNSAFHHGSWLQTTAARPSPIAFSTPLVPVHVEGLLAEGSLPVSDGLLVGYMLGVVDGRGTALAQKYGLDAGPMGANPAGGIAIAADYHRQAYIATVQLRPSALRGLQIGGALYTDRPMNGLGQQVDERTSSVHFVLERDSPEIIVEHTWIQHRETLGGSWTTGTAWYAQVGQRLRGTLDAFMPYARVEGIDVADDDPLLGGIQATQDALVLGVRVDFVSVAALRVEYRRDSMPARDLNRLHVQVSYVFGGLSGG